jgi:hypothetical protein
MRCFRHKFWRKSKHSYIQWFYFESCRLWDNVQKYCTAQTTMRMSTACWIPKNTGTHSEYIILNPLPLEQWLQGRNSMLCYRYTVFKFKDGIKLLPTNITSGCMEDLIHILSLKHDKDNSFLFGRPCLREQNCSYTVGMRLIASLFWPMSGNLPSCDGLQCSCWTRRKWHCPIPGSIPPTYGRNSMEWYWLPDNGWASDENGHN